MHQQTDHPAIHDLLRELGPRLGDLESRTHGGSAPRMDTLRETIAHLRATVEALERAQEVLLRSEAGGEAPRTRVSEREAERLRQGLLRSVDVALAALDLDGTVLLWNAAAEGLLGWTEDQVAGRPFPGVDEPTRARLAAARGEGPQRLATPVRRADGGTVQMELAVAPLVDGEGRVRGTSVHLAPLRDDDAARDGHRATAGGRGSWTRDEALEALLASDGSEGDPLAWLRAWVASGVHLGYLRPGDRLPSIRQVAAATGLDHRAVSQAYRTLAGEAMVEIRDRHGVHIAQPAAAAADDDELCESAEWLCGILAQACTLRVRTALLPDVVRRWTTTVPLRCACVESSEDDRTMLATELRQQWALETFPVALDGTGDRRSEAVLAAALRDADLAVTTPFHEGEVRAAAAPLGIPVVVVRASRDVVVAAEQRLRQGTLTAVVADEAFGRRLRLLRGAEGDRLRVVQASDAEAVAALDPAEPVLLTRAAQELLPGVRLRLLVPVSPYLCASSAPALAEVIVARNMEAERRRGGG